MKRFIGVLLGVLFLWNTFAVAEGALPIAPRRSDDRDELPLDSFVSINRRDPVTPGEKAPAPSASPVPAKSGMVAKGTKPAAKGKAGAVAQKAGAKGKAVAKSGSASSKRMPASDTKKKPLPKKPAIKKKK